MAHQVPPFMDAGADSSAALNGSERQQRL